MWFAECRSGNAFPLPADGTDRLQVAMNMRIQYMQIGVKVTFEPTLARESGAVPESAINKTTRS